ncbi:hypothetical protein M427DRAFT_59916 [Gonapodya prolifera JEL478]|uniref:Ataxin-10 homolog n=1 Tax=Gonapodya prolifera (strain JEL478) TaxID=1344416 RepID=A0A139A5X8_GONPJ|nr:hypothetical protein M427DRAFT_59916 [Gonapodya prolifera JEL478]|eukprot:KXS12059.1 hypothetical protein M427DRAFT_59916 [Gonapodya prolifera JEL478]
MLCAKHVRPLLELLLNRLTSHLGTTTTTDTNSAEDDGTTSQDPVYQLMYGIFSNIISLDLSPSLLGTLRPPSSSKSILTPHQLSFLKILDGHIHSTSTSQQPADAAEDPLAILPLNTTLHLCHILHTTSSRATDYLFGLRDATGDSLLTQLQAQPRDATAPRDEVAPLDLEGLIVTLGVLAAIGESADTTVKEEISKQGTVGDLISLLRDLNLFQTRTKPSSDAAPNAARTGAAKSPLFMLKSEVVTVLSNLCHECAVVQDEIRERDAIPLILEQCNLDDANPFLREHAILLVRNLCTGNTANQDYIRSLEAQKVVVSEDLLDTVGGRLQIDAAGKVQLKRG